MAVAQTLGLPFREELLFQPAYNIRVGGWYIGRLFHQYRAALPRAIGAFNAGPGAMGRWVRQWPDDEVDLFVERIPYDETRGYTKRVLSSFLVYSWLLPGTTPLRERIPRLAFQLPTLGAKAAGFLITGERIDDREVAEVETILETHLLPASDRMRTKAEIVEYLEGRLEPGVFIAHAIDREYRVQHALGQVGSGTFPRRKPTNVRSVNYR